MPRVLAHVSRSWLLIFVITFGTSIVVASILKSLIEDRMIAIGKRWAKRLQFAQAAQTEKMSSI
jgi:peptidoglycan/LPS O-acetylase OafA/YrhL